MRYQITGQGWPLQGGAFLVPGGTIIDTSLPAWSMAQGLTPPINCQALDSAAHQALLAT